MAAILDDIVILIEARLDRLEVSMKEAEKIVENSVGRMDRAVSGGTGGGGFFFFGGKGIRPAISRQLAGIAALAAGINVANVAMKNLSESSKIFSGSIDSAVDGIFALGRELEKSAIFKPLFSLTRGVGDFLLTIRETIEALAGEPFITELPESPLMQIINEVFGGTAIRRRKDKLSESRLDFQRGVSELRLAAEADKEIAFAKDREDRINIIAKRREAIAKDVVLDLQAARRKLFPTEAQALPADILKILLTTIEQERLNAIQGLGRQGGGFNLQTFQTPLGVAAFSGLQGGERRSPSEILQDIHLEVKKVNRNIHGRVDR